MDKCVFLEGKKVILRPIFKEEISMLQRWINDPQIRIFLTATFPMTIEQEARWFEKIGSSQSNVILGIVDKEKDLLIGSMGLHDINWIDRRATTGTLIGDKAYWSKGYGTDAKMQLLNYAFNTLNLRKIKSEVIQLNNRSLKYAEKCGYKVEGVLKAEHYKDGEHHDCVRLAVFKEDWLPFWETYSKENL